MWKVYAQLEFAKSLDYLKACVKGQLTAEINKLNSRSRGIYIYIGTDNNNKRMKLSLNMKSKHKDAGAAVGQGGQKKS